MEEREISVYWWLGVWLLLSTYQPGLWKGGYGPEDKNQLVTCNLYSF